MATPPNNPPKEQPKSTVPSAEAVIGSVVAVVVGIAACYWLIWKTGDKTVLHLGSDYSAFGALFILTAALERLLAPATWRINGVPAKEAEATDAAADASIAQTEAIALRGAPLLMPATAFGADLQAEYLAERQAVVAAASTAAEVARTKVKTAEEKAAELAQKKADATVYLWAVATIAAAAICAYAGALLLRVIISPNTPAPPVWFDLTLTALVVGAGTSQLHSLVTNTLKPKP